MNIKEAIKIIKDEKLQGYNMNEERYNRENEVVLRCENDKWIVYATDERASKVTNSQDIYFDEEEALDNFIDRLRALNRLRGYSITEQGSHKRYSYFSYSEKKQSDKS